MLRARRPSALSVLVLCLAVAAPLAGCSTAGRRRHPAPAPAEPPVGPATSPGPASPGPASPWISPIGRDHPLVGKTFDTATGRPVSQADVVRALASADVAILGEQHDNADHHRLQAALLRALVEAGRRPAVAFEQIDLDRQDAVERARSTAAGKTPAEAATAIADAVGWDRSGWPSFDLYRPLFEIALERGLPIRAANLSRARMHELFTAGASGATAEARGLPLVTSAQRASMEADIEESHCGEASRAMVEMMVEAQRRRDAAMAGAVEGALDASAGAAGGRGSAVLVSGFGHARRDYGVPLYLAHDRPGLRVVSVAFLEVSPEAKSPADYAKYLHAKALPFDFVTFTPRADDEDPCEKFRAGLQKLKAP